MTTHSHLITDRHDAQRYVLSGGNALVTLVGQERRFTFRVCASDAAKGGTIHFVHVLTGPDNTARSSYTFVGTIFQDGVFKHSPKSTIGERAQSAQAWRWFWTRGLRDDAAYAKVQVWHHGRCGRCGRLLTDDASIKRGLGPVCAEKAA